MVWCFTDCIGRRCAMVMKGWREIISVWVLSEFIILRGRSPLIYLTISPIWWKYRNFQFTKTHTKTTASFNLCFCFKHCLELRLRRHKVFKQVQLCWELSENNLLRWIFSKMVIVRSPIFPKMCYQSFYHCPTVRGETSQEVDEKPGEG